MPMGTGKKKIEIKRKEKESDRMVTFSKRRKGLFKKAHQLHSISGANIAVLVFSPAGKPYVHGDPSFDATIDQYYTTITNAEGIANAKIGGCNVVEVDEEKKYEQEFELWRSWLETMDVEEYDEVADLFLLKHDLEKIREKLIKTIADDE